MPRYLLIYYEIYFIIITLLFVKGWALTRLISWTQSAFKTSLHKQFRPRFLLKYKIYFVYQNSLIRTINTTFFLNNLWEFTTKEQKFKRWFCTQKPIFNVCFKDFWYTKKNWIRFDLMGNSINNHLRLKIFSTQHEFSNLNNVWLYSPNQLWVKNI